MPRLVPNYLTMAPDGTVGANFTGHVHAHGLDLDASSQVGVFTPDNAVRWERQTDGTVVAEVESWGDESLLSSALELSTTLGPSFNDLLTLRLRANRDGSIGSSRLEVVANADGAPGATATVLASDGSSDFLQLANGPVLGVIDFGVTSVVWGGASTISGAAAVAHGLTRVPRAVLPGCRVRSDGGVAYPVYSGVTSGGFSVQGIAPAAPAAGVSCNVSWIVIG